MRSCTELVVADAELDVVFVEIGTLSSKYLMKTVRNSAYVLNDLSWNTPSSPKGVSSMIDFGAETFASSSTP